jgi:hypothetical protein
MRSLLTFTGLFRRPVRPSRVARARFRPCVDGMEDRLLLTVLPWGFV